MAKAERISSEAIPPEGHTDLVSKLPTREGWSQPLVLYKNFWLRPQLAENIMRLQNSFRAHQDDIILATNPKCGTTWLKALAFTVANRSRILTTHMPVSLLPDSILACGCRLVYICRDPKDAFVSRWHFENRIRVAQEVIELQDAFNNFCEGVSSFGPFWDHCLGYWRESATRPHKVLFLKYEEMMSEPVKHVRRLARFLGVLFSGEEELGRIPEEVVRLCSFEKLSSLPGNQTGEIIRRKELVIEKSMYFRRGEVGDWVNHMSPEMGRKLDDIVEEKFRGSGLVL
ncbi:hypothetical protein ACP4OV_019402 [Aristida adscensionis]